MARESSNALLHLERTASTDTQLRPFPTENLAQELIHLILYHVLSEPDFGPNGRWALRDEATREKLQWSKAHKQRATLHLKFCLIHRSWTPYVLRSLYRAPRLTSKFSIQRLTDCLTHPEKLWGVDVSKETGKVVGGVVGDRKHFVRHMGFHIGSGRESSVDWIMYSGYLCGQQTLSRYVHVYMDGNLKAGVPGTAPRKTLRDFLLSITVCRDCDEEGYHQQNQKANIFGDARNKDSVYSALRNCPLEALGLKVAGGNRRAGVLDDILEVIPGIRRLFLAADLVSPAFFDQELPKHLSEILFGCSTRKPVVFSGRKSVETLWEIGRTFAKSNSAYMEKFPAMDTRTDQRDTSAITCDISSSGALASLHQRYRYPGEYPPLDFEHNYILKLHEELAKNRSAYEPYMQPFDWENAFAYEVSNPNGRMSPVGLESWLAEETGETGSLRDFAVQESEIIKAVQALCWRD
ncbi:hypothetical protein QFC19_004152 [Naganishia cerealis]|uniref:Uncharacterized protein n=1 Tax=Naganishia cerealis TaxID=610337 RepID=A0ACC2VX68_9TREE|nr:hypothetical protein QFC19_004152 [Naganishia cerealis]